MPQAWSNEEVAATVNSYFQMLALEQKGEKYNKAAFRKQLLEQLNNRSAGSIEFKHQNISAVLRDLGMDYIKGYKPLANYQKSLKEAVLSAIEDSKAAADEEEVIHEPYEFGLRDYEPEPEEEEEVTNAEGSN